ncbi:hypothetical protein [Sinomonas humi]|uniref:Uncharacterized protein n=1 Tax=Sinomonas humi TaxID=1338436 RepID=A0A0B2ARE3_9MICC|nr:hypothetical protein [Sinomonas humi]KHL04519.1 hypothetical protein LK10_04810 [Sinomonas humi]
MSEQPGPRPWPPQPGAGSSPESAGTGSSFAAPPRLSPEDAETSRRWRLVLGITSLVLALACGFYAFTNTVAVVSATRAIEANGGFVPQSAMAMAVAIIVTFGVLALGYAGIGIWNIVARGSESVSPLIAALVVSGIAVVLTVLYMISTASIGLQAVGLALNALIIARAVGLLRMKKAPRGTVPRGA